MQEFNFMGCIELKELLGLKANDVQKLLELVEEVPADSIYYHTHSYFLRHFYITGPYSNDFANWAVIQVRDRVLGEKLSCVTPSPNKSLEDIRFELIEIIDEHLTDQKIVPAVVYGHPFYFMKSQIIKVPTGLSAHNINEFIEALKEVDASAIYNHVFEARQRQRKGRSDFSQWIEEEMGLLALAEKFESVDTYMFSLEGLRIKLLKLCNGEKENG
ncbi:MAG: hypothetical protein HOC71_17025 [Candidatus Latescibacteria bacterium]|jgi:hypothetical protein|nr:hypothetical protein [Candidatus Latescibacterota bacterium]